MKNFKRILASFVMLITLLAITPVGASASWKSNTTGWWYTEGNSWATGWKLINANWYYFYSDGYMAKNKIIDGYYLNSSGAWSISNSSVEEAHTYLNGLSIQDKKQKYQNCTDADILNILMSNMYYFGTFDPK